MNTTVTLLLLGTLVAFVQSIPVEDDYEFEDIKHSDGDDDSVWRSQANGYKAMRLYRNGRKSITLTLCAYPRTFHDRVTAVIKNIRYSNDGPSDKVLIFLNGQPIGQFFTHSVWNGGAYWNRFYNTGVVGLPFMVGQGMHKLVITAETDIYGVEIDSMKFETENQEEGKVFLCRGAFTGDGDD